MEKKQYLLKVKNYLISLEDGTKPKEEIMAKMSKLNNNRLTKAIIDNVYEDIRHFSFAQEQDLAYLPSAIKVLDSLGEKTNLNKLVVIFFENLHKELLKLLSINDEQSKVVLNALNILEKETKNYSYDSDEFNDKNHEAIISYVLFDLKDYSLFDRMIKKHKNLVNTVDKKGNPLIKKIIWRYLIAINKYIEENNRIDLQYYYKVFNRILTDKNFRMNKEEIKAYNSLITCYLKKFDKLEDSKKKEEVSYYKNKIVLSLLGSSIDDNSLETLDFEYGISKDFSLPINTESKKIYIMNSNIEPSTNTKRVYTFDHHPNEIDDGMAVSRKDGLLISEIVIADPTRYIPFNSIITNEARKRTESIYIDSVDGNNICIPMLPPLLSKDLMSLNEGKNTYSINFIYYYDEITGNLVKKEVKEEITNVYKNYDYEDYDAIIRHGTDEEIIKDLEDMEKIAGFMARDYDQTIIRGLVNTKSKAARGINVVTNHMISNNVNMAKWAEELGIPFAYRNHILDEGKETINHLKNKVLAREPITSIFKLIEMLDNICPNAKYSSVCLGHDTLGTKYYSHTTSPLRRFIDVLNIMCIKKFIINQDYTDDDVRRYREYICKVIEEVNTKRKFIESYGKEYEKRLVLKH